MTLICLGEIDGGVVLKLCHWSMCVCMRTCAYVRGEGAWNFGQRVGRIDNSTLELDSYTNPTLVKDGRVGFEGVHHCNLTSTIQ